MKSFLGGRIVSRSSGIGDTAFDHHGPVYPLRPTALDLGSTETPPVYDPLEALYNSQPKGGRKL